MDGNNLSATAYNTNLTGNLTLYLVLTGSPKVLESWAVSQVWFAVKMLLYVPRKLANPDQKWPPTSLLIIQTASQVLFRLSVAFNQ